METFLGLDFPTWWFLLVGAVFSGYAILDGFDLGAGALHLFLNKEHSRRIALNAIGPVWDGNEVWLVIGGGALFAGFPVVYGTLLSAMYIPFILFLVLLIFRAISIEFRSKEPMLWWRKMWDVSYSISSISLSLLLGIVLGNVLQGMPIGADREFAGNWVEFINPFAILTGLTTLALFMMHGSIYLALKTEGRLFAKMTRIVKNTTIFFVLCFSILSISTLLFFPHLSEKFRDLPILFGIPILALLSIANLTRLVNRKRYRQAFFFSALSVSLLLILVAIPLYPNIIISTSDPAHSLTVYNSAASTKSLKIMLTFAAIGVPLVIAYTTFVFWTFRGKVKMDEMSY